MSRKEVELQGVDYEKLNALMSESVRQAKKARGLEVVMYVGPTGSGKTTGLYKMDNVPVSEIEDEEGFGTKVVVADPKQAMHGPIGHTEESETQHSHIAVINNIAHCDCPGFGDTRKGLEIAEKLCSVATIPLVVQNAESIKAVMVYFDVTTLKAARGHAFKKLVRTLGALFKDFSSFSQEGPASNILFVLTHMPDGVNVNKIMKKISAKIKRKKEVLESSAKEAKVLCEQLSEVINGFNEKLLAAKTEKAKQQLIKELEASQLRPEDKGRLARLRLAMVSVMEAGESLVVLEVLKSNAKNCYIMRGSGKDDVKKIHQHIGRIKTAIPKESFAFNSREGSEWHIWRKLIEKIAFDGSLLRNRLEALADEQPELEAFSALRADNAVSYERLETKLSVLESPSVRELLSLSNSLKEKHTDLKKSIGDSLVKKEHEIERLGTKLKDLDSETAVPYQPQSLSPVCMDVPDGQKAAHVVAAGFAALLPVLAAIPSFLLWGRRSTGREKKIGFYASSEEEGMDRIDPHNLGGRLLTASMIPLSLAVNGTRVHAYTFRYVGVPYLSYTTDPSRKSPLKHRHLFKGRFVTEKTFCFDSESIVSKSAEGKLAATCVNSGGAASKGSVAAILLIVKSYLHPDNAPVIAVLKESIKFLKAGMLSRLESTLKSMDESFSKDAMLMERKLDLSAWKESLLSFLSNRLEESALEQKHLEAAKEELSADITSTQAELKSLTPRFAMAGLMLPLIDANKPARAFLDNYSEEFSAPAVAGGGGSKEGLSARLQTSMLTGGGGAEASDVPVVASTM